MEAQPSEPQALQNMLLLNRRDASEKTKVDTVDVTLIEHADVNLQQLHYKWDFL